MFFNVRVRVHGDVCPRHPNKRWKAYGCNDAHRQIQAVLRREFIEEYERRRDKSGVHECNHDVESVLGGLIAFGVE